MRQLCLGTLAATMTPDNSILAGAWCSAGAADVQPPAAGFSPESFVMPEEPFADPDRLDLAAQQARVLIADLVPLIADYLNHLHGVQRDARYWDFVLAPWLTRVAEVLLDRLYRAEGLLEAFGTEELLVPVLPPDSGFSFADTQDFILNGMLSPQWNHWLLSRLLTRAWPECWTMLPLASVRRAAPSATQGSLLRRAAKRVLFALPFPRIKGFSTCESLRLSLTLLGNRTAQDDTLSLEQATRSDSLGRTPLPLGYTLHDAFEFACALLPQSLLRARIPSRPGFLAVKRRVVSVAACEDDAYRLRMANCRGAGCRLIFIQHGGEYGFVRTSVAYPMVEYRQHRFITWGWTRHGAMPGQFVPLPHPQLAALRNTHRETAPELILVGTEMALLPYTLKSMLRGRQFFAYREDKGRFLAALPAELRVHTSYRPYFDVPSSLEDAPWVLRHFPEVRRCVGPLEPHLLGCRLLVLDHAGTTLGQALAANIPFLLYWDPALTHFAPEVLPLLESLRQAGILHDTPESAAEQAGTIWDQVPEWWASTAEARKPWADQHALTTVGPVLPLWRAALKQM